MTYPLSADAYDIISLVGRGATARVYKGTCIPLGTEVALKIINLDQVNMSLEQFQREISIMRKSNHENVTKLHASFVSGNCLWLVLGYYPYGSVSDCMQSVKQKIPFWHTNEKILVNILYQSLSALIYFHENDQIHRDVKAGNLLINLQGEVVMADFGVSSEAPLIRGASVTRKTFVGTPCWMAPEVITMKGYKKSADIWSLGITALEIAFGAPPYAQYPPMKVMALTLKVDPPVVDMCGKNGLSQEYKDFVTLCLRKKADQRPTAAQLISHPLFAGIPSVTAAAEVVREGLQSIGVSVLTEHPANYDRDTCVFQVNGDDKAEGSEWDFPTIANTLHDELDPGVEPWRRALYQNHIICMSGYVKGSIAMTDTRHTAYQGTIAGTTERVTIHELELDPVNYAEPFLTDDATAAALSLSNDGLLPCREIWENGINKVFWVTESQHCGTLHQMIENSGPLSESEVRAKGVKLGEGLRTLHKMGILHRRVIPFYVHSMGNTDLRLGCVMSMLLPPKGKISMKTLDPPQSVEVYLAPEQFDDDFDFRVDIYSFALLLLEMLTGRVPYLEAKNPVKLVQLKCKGTPPASLTSIQDSPFYPLIQQCLQPEPEERPTMEEVLAHPCWLSSADAGA
eukprot:TRINITY_DN23524_c0_g1_i1.p1 TRINITY_DN23524_c0_g1~~TRINITY_DN23524_c0_g1_i1.p1  ORF type:complete len:645 (+),score=175.69 TRINITY_DN23524_c0_g1_i1:55-1935(+)